MRIIIEDSDGDNKNKRRTAVECENDDVHIDEAMDMMLRSFTAFGYSREAISGYFSHVVKTYEEMVDNTEEQPAPSEDGLENAFAEQQQLPDSE